MFRNKYIFIRNLATLFIVCNMLYWFFPFPPIFWRVGLVLLSLYAAFSNGYKTLAEKMILVFVAFNLLHFIVSFLWKIPSTTQIGNILCSMLPFGLFVYLGKKGVMTETYFMVAVPVLLVASILGYYQMQAIMLRKLMLDPGADVVNNATVCFLFLLPLLFFVEKKWLKWLVMAVCLYFLIEGAKRGNIIAAFIPTLLVLWYELKDSRHSAFKTTAIFIGIIALSFALYQWFTTNDYLMYRLGKTIDGNSSGRNEIYAIAWHVWYNSNSFVHYIFGYGFDGTLQHVFWGGGRMHAHCDWLEIIVDYGLIGVVLYLSIFVSFAKMIWKTNDTGLKLVMLSAVCIWLFKSAYSMGFTEGDMSLLMISLGTAIGQNNLQNKRIESQ